MDQVINIDIDLIASRLQQKLVQKSPLSAYSCIFKVPSTLRSYNENLFRPSLVSIGPYHRGDVKLKPMESIKLWYLQCLLDRKPTPETTLKCFIGFAISSLNKFIGSYSEPVKHGLEELVEMMVIDGCFIIEYFRKFEDIVQPSSDDPLFNMSWIRKVLVIDLLLLENQLPWFILDYLYKLTKANREKEKLSLPQLAHVCLVIDTLRVKSIRVDPCLQIKHLLDLQRSIILFSNEDNNDEHNNDTHNSSGNGWHSIPCVTELLQAGIKFQVGSRNNLMNIQFKEGKLIIPPILVLDNAESLLRNLIAYEQCDKNLEMKITSYAGFLDNLINSSADVDYLRQEKIITCYLSTEDVSSFFRRLYKDAHVVHYSFAKVSGEIEAYYMGSWPRWRAMLIRDYFGNPWSIISLVAGIIILVLTFLQTVLAFIG